MSRFVGYAMRTFNRRKGTHCVTYSAFMSRVLEILLLIGFGFIIGFFIGSTKFNAAMGDVKWTDVGSLLVTLSGLILAVVTYTRWSKTKIQDDAYLTAKQYLSLILSLKSQIFNLAAEFNHLVPQPGKLVEDETTVHARINRCNDIYSSLVKNGLEISIVKEQLKFWRIDLTKNGEELHNNLIKLLNDHLIYSDVMNINVKYHYFSDKSKILELTLELEKWRNSAKLIIEAHEKILSTGFSGLFITTKV
jgi:hypothetical protein